MPPSKSRCPNDGEHEQHVGREASGVTEAESKLGAATAEGVSLWGREGGRRVGRFGRRCVATTRQFLRCTD
jgi:hypothetical protein